MEDARTGQPAPLTTAELIDIWAGLHDTIVGGIEDALGGERLRDILYQPLVESGRAAARQAIGGQSQADATGIARNIMRLEEAFDLQGQVLEERPDHFAREVTKCPWSHVRPASCKVFAWWMEGYCQGLNPHYCYQLEQLIPEGAETCRWSVSSRGPSVSGCIPDS